MNGRTIAIVPAAGMGVRFGPGVKKTFIELLGKPVIVWTLEGLCASQAIDEIIPVVRQEDMQEAESLVEKFNIGKISRIAPGGKERHDSVTNGFRLVEDESAVVLVHDGARPLVSGDVIAAVVNGLEGHDGCICAVTPKDTIKEITERGVVRRTLKRHTLSSVQTPQAFSYKVLSEAYRKAAKEGYHSTDDSALVERYGGRVKVVEGSYDNIKITTPEDLALAEALLKKRAVAGEVAK